MMVSGGGGENDGWWYGARLTKREKLDDGGVMRVHRERVEAGFYWSGIWVD